MRNGNLRAAIWFVALVLLASWMTSGWFRHPTGNRLVLFDTPFDQTPGLDRGQWQFLQQIHEVLPEGAPYTIRAATPDLEMQLYMLAAGVVDGREGVPSTYYGVANDGAAAIRWIASYQCAVVPPDATIVLRVSDGCVCERGK